MTSFDDVNDFSDDGDDADDTGDSAAMMSTGKNTDQSSSEENMHRKMVMMVRDLLLGWIAPAPNRHRIGGAPAPHRHRTGTEV